MYADLIWDSDDCPQSQTAVAGDFASKQLPLFVFELAIKNSFDLRPANTRHFHPRLF